MMNGLQVVASEAAAAAADITDERTVTKTMMTPRIDDLVPSNAVGGETVANVLAKNAIDNVVHQAENSENSNLYIKQSNLNQSVGNDEKCDTDPENSRKSCDVTPDTADEVLLVEQMHLDGASNQCSPEKNANPDKDVESTEMSKSAMAFTIDFNDGKQVDTKKYNNIFERFQKRHSRGASMSKLDDPGVNGSIKSKPPLQKAVGSQVKVPLVAITTNSASLDETTSPLHIVAMRDKGRLSRKESTNPSNRHSWSPRNSVHVNSSISGDFDDVLSSKHKISLDKPPQIKAKAFQPKSETLQRTFESIKNKGYNLHEKSNRRSESDNIVCEAPPLEYRKGSSNDSISSVSEAGTYTLDGDNYTEEQKEEMSIDKMSKLSQAVISATHVDHAAMGEHTLDKPKTKTSYLERIKSKVKNISDRTFHKNRSPDAEVPLRQNQLTYQPSHNVDIGNFTSVTSAGVFSKHTTQQQITPKVVKVSRKGSLTKSQVDSSEFIQKMDDQVLNSFTDYEKARHSDYQLNIFTGQQETEFVSNKNVSSTRNSDSFSIERAETKNDWIQEWAKNARRNTKKKSNTPTNNMLHRNQIAQYETCQATSSSDFSDVNSYAQSSRQHEIPFNEANNYTDSMNRFEMRSAAGRRPPQQHIEHHMSPRQSFGRRGSLNNAYNLRSNHSEFGDDLDDDMSTGSSMQPCSLMLDADRGRREYYNFASHTNQMSRPPLSPTKIPSPMHSLSRPRSSSVNRSIHSSITDLDSHNDDTGMYLHKTAAAISQLQCIQRNQILPQSPQRQTNKIASNFMTSPSIRRHYKTAPFSTINNNPSPTTEHHPHTQLFSSSSSLNKRNHSLDTPEDNISVAQRDQMFNSYNSDGLNALLNLKFPHSRHNSYEDKPSPVRSIGSTKTIDQTFAPQIVQRSNISVPNSTPQLSKRNITSAPIAAAPSRGDTTKVRSKSANVTPATIKRSSSFSTKPFVRPSSGNKAMPVKKDPRSNASLQKSASSNSFKNMSSKYEADIYLNQNDDLYARVSSDSELSGADPNPNERELLTNTRYNKAFLARLEQNKQKSNVVQTQLKPGVSACPNTPELPRRDTRVRQSLRDRASMPRDSSIVRMKQDLAASMKNPTESTGAASRSASTTGTTSKVLPKYLDISKYKPTQGNTFLKRDESKSTLNPQYKEIVKRSNSSFGVGMNKSDAGRSSVRSAKSATANNRPTMSASKDEATREADLAMWRRRASYDPMKAAAEGKRKQEEKNVTHASKYNESSSAVLRSKSYHSGVGQPIRTLEGEETGSKRWTLISTESSDEDLA